MARTAKAAGAPVVTAVFNTPEQIESAYQIAVEHGYTIGDVNVVMSEETRRRLYAEKPDAASEISKKAAEGAELGGPTGGRVGIASTCRRVRLKSSTKQARFEPIRTAMRSSSPPRVTTSDCCPT